MTFLIRYRSGKRIKEVQVKAESEEEITKKANRDYPEWVDILFPAPVCRIER